jgi:hypothetical protein
MTVDLKVDGYGSDEVDGYGSDEVDGYGSDEGRRLREH